MTDVNIVKRSPYKQAGAPLAEDRILGLPVF